MNLFKKKKTKIDKVDISDKGIEVEDIIAPSSITISSDHLKLGEKLVKSFFIFSYPRYLSAAWTLPLINLSKKMDISFFIHPSDSGVILKQLRRRVTEVQAEINERTEKGLIRDPQLETAYQDIESLRDRIQTAQERMFKLGIYLNIYEDTVEQLKETENVLRSMLESRLMYIKPSLHQQKDSFISASPYGEDLMFINTSMNTEPLSSIFPFVSFDLSSNNGILYGVNIHNNSLVLFDRFSLENANMTVFAKSGSGKSYFVKLEALRSLMMGIDVMVIDPENEYKFLSEAVGGSFINVSLSSPHHINPFDLPLPREDEEPQDVLRSNVINLVGMFRVMLQGLTPEEDSLIDSAITETYAIKDITVDTDPTQWNKNVPLMQDFETILEGMVGTDSLVQKIRKFTRGSYAEFFNNYTNVDTNKKFVSFGIRDMEDELRPIAMFIIMRYVWNKIREELKQRILIIDEAWILMKDENSASFLFGVAKRARKYWLGLTTITQDVGDFMKSKYGKPILTNSSLQFLMKQSPATIDIVQKTFNLTEEEKYLLLEATVGEGIFFAGQKHVGIQVTASYTEDQIITTSPEQISKRNKAASEEEE
jgi:type IV secretory pathway VirB4 component